MDLTFYKVAQLISLSPSLGTLSPHHTYTGL